MTETTAYTLVSAVVGDAVDGVEVSDPASPIDIRDYPDALVWAVAQGWGPDRPAELIYVVNGPPPAGFESFTIQAAAR